MTDAGAIAFLGIDNAAAFCDRASICETFEGLLAAARGQDRLAVIHGSVLANRSQPFHDLQALRQLCPTIIVGSEIPVELRGGADVATALLGAESLEALGDEARMRWEHGQQLCRGRVADAVSKVAGGIAHDLNNILMVIMGPLEMAAPEAKGTPLEDLIDMGLGATENAAEMTRRLSGFSSRSDEPAAHDLNQLLEHAAGTSRDRYAGAHPVTVRAPTRELPVVVSSQRLARGLMNLIENAAEATPVGGEIIVETSDQPIDFEGAQRRSLTTTMPGRYFVVSVRDTGEGMGDDVLPRAGELFFSTRGKGHTGGLGLALTRAFLESEGHGLVIESAPGRGTAVHCLIRRADVSDGE